MRRRRVWLAVAGALVLTGCGVPDETGVVADADGLPRQQSITDTRQVTPPRPAEANTPEQLVDFYLLSAAGDLSGAPSRMREFLSDGKRSEWTAGSEITVVRKVGTPVSTDVGGGSTRVDVMLQPVGRIATDSGAVEPVVDRPAEVHQFMVIPAENGPRRVINQVRDGMFMNSVALDDDQFYTTQTIYFWDRSGQTLVPDVRHMPKSWPEAQRPTEAARWLLKGPSPWLELAVQQLPAGIELRGRVLRDGDRRVVDLSAKARAVEDMDKLVVQLRWSLRHSDGGGDVPLTLKVEGIATREGSGEEFLRANPAADPPAEDNWFCVVAGVVRPGCVELAAGVAALSPEVNTGVAQAAITRDGQRAALVRADGKGSYALWLSRNEAGAAKPEYRTTGLAGRNLSRPVWLTADRRQASDGLVLVDGRLYQFGLDQPAREVALRAGAAAAFSVAPDNRRIALVIGGRPYVAPLVVEQGAVLVGSLRQLPTRLRDISAVAWSQQQRIVLAGHGEGRSELVELSIDGALEKDLRADGLGTSVVTQLVALTDNPSDWPATGAMMLDANGRAYRVGIRIDPITMKVQSTPPPARPTEAFSAFFAD